MEFLEAIPTSGFVILYCMAIFCIWFAASIFGFTGFGLGMKVFLTVALIPITAMIVNSMAD